MGKHVNRHGSTRLAKFIWLETRPQHFVTAAGSGSFARSHDRAQDERQRLRQAHKQEAKRRAEDEGPLISINWLRHKWGEEQTPYPHGVYMRNLTQALELARAQGDPSAPYPLVRPLPKRGASSRCWA